MTTFTTFVAGTTAKAAEVNDNFTYTLYTLNGLAKLQNETAINLVSATHSGVLASSSQKMIDKFLDSTGQNNTIDSTNTTAEYSPLKYYKCVGSSDIAEPSFETVASWTYSESNARFTGARDNTWASKGTYSYKFAKASGGVNEGEYAQILQSKDVTAWTTFMFDYNCTATSAVNDLKLQVLFGTAVLYEKVLAVEMGTAYFSTAGITGTKDVIFRVIAQQDTGSNLMAIYIDNIVTTNTDSLIQSIPFNTAVGATKIFVTPLMYEPLTGSDNILTSAYINPSSTYTIATYGAASGSETVSKGFIIKALTSRRLVSVTKQVGSGAPTTARLQTAAGADIATASFSGEVATFSTPQALTAGTIYKVVVDSGGSAYTGIAVSVPVTDFGDFSIIGYDSARATLSALTFNSASGETAQTSIVSNTWTSLSATSEGVCYIKMNLDTNTGATTPKVLGWCVLLE